VKFRRVPERDNLNVRDRRYLQSRGNGVKRGKKSVIPDNALSLKGGDLGFGSLLFLGKNLPSPRFKMNMFVDYDIGTGKINYPADISAAIKKLNVLLQGLTDNSKIMDSVFTGDEDIDTSIL